MRTLISLLFAAILVYLGWYVYDHLTDEEKTKVISVGKTTLDKAGDTLTEGTKKILEKVDEPATQIAE